MSHDTKRDDPAGLSWILKAFWFASQKHSHQRRKDSDASPYINHPIMLANILWNEAGVRDPSAIIAAILHDTVEDTATTPQELEAEFGAHVRSIVAEVTDDKSLPKHVRKQLQIEHAASASPAAQMVKMADKIANLRDLVRSPPKAWPEERIIAYFDWAKAVVDEMRGRHARLEALFDETYATRPASRPIESVGPIGSGEFSRAAGAASTDSSMTEGSKDSLHEDRALLDPNSGRDPREGGHG